MDLCDNMRQMFNKYHCHSAIIHFVLIALYTCQTEWFVTAVSSLKLVTMVGATKASDSILLCFCCGECHDGHSAYLLGAHQLIGSDGSSSGLQIAFTDSEMSPYGGPCGISIVSVALPTMHGSCSDWQISP